jgi:hypothetical protein
LTINKLRQFLLERVFIFFYSLTKIFNLMKKVNFKAVMLTLAFAFAFLLGASSMQAQVSTALNAGGGSNSTSKATYAVYSVPQGNFQDNTSAKATLMSTMVSIKATLTQLTNEVDPVFITLARKVKYYYAINEALNQGMTVPQAIVDGLKVFHDPEWLTPAQLLALKNEAIALLD